MNGKYSQGKTPIIINIDNMVGMEKILKNNMLKENIEVGQKRVSEGSIEENLAKDRLCSIGKCLRRIYSKGLYIHDGKYIEGNILGI